MASHDRIDFDTILDKLKDATLKMSEGLQVMVVCLYDISRQNDSRNTLLDGKTNQAKPALCRGQLNRRDTVLVDIPGKMDGSATQMDISCKKDLALHRFPLQPQPTQGYGGCDKKPAISVRKKGKYNRPLVYPPCLPFMIPYREYDYEEILVAKEFMDREFNPDYA